MADFTILEQGREPGKDQRYARCLYGDNAADVTVIIDRQVLDGLKERGIADFPRVVEAALDAAHEVDSHPTQVAVLKHTPILQNMMARLQRTGVQERAPAPHL